MARFSVIRDLGDRSDEMIVAVAAITIFVRDG